MVSGPNAVQGRYEVTVYDNGWAHLTGPPQHSSPSTFASLKALRLSPDDLDRLRGHATAMRPYSDEIFVVRSVADFQELQFGAPGAMVMIIEQYTLPDVVARARDAAVELVKRVATHGSPTMANDDLPPQARLVAVRIREGQGSRGFEELSVFDDDTVDHRVILPSQYYAAPFPGTITTCSVDPERVDLLRDFSRRATPRRTREHGRGSIYDIEHIAIGSMRLRWQGSPRLPSAIDQLRRTFDEITPPRG